MSNLEVKKNLNVEDKKEEKVKIMKFKRKYEMLREDVKSLPTIDVVLTRNNKYNLFTIMFKLAPYLNITQRISNSDYVIALKENNTSLSFDKVSWKIHYRLLKGKKKDNESYWYGVELYVSTNCRLSFFLKDRDLLALNTMGIELDFKEVLIDDSEFGVIEIND